MRTVRAGSSSESVREPPRGGSVTRLSSRLLRPACAGRLQRCQPAEPLVPVTLPRFCGSSARTRSAPASASTSGMTTSEPTGRDPRAWLKVRGAELCVRQDGAPVLAPRPQLDDVGRATREPFPMDARVRQARPGRHGPRIYDHIVEQEASVPLDGLRSAVIGSVQRPRACSQLCAPRKREDAEAPRTIGGRGRLRARDGGEPKARGQGVARSRTRFRGPGPRRHRVAADRRRLGAPARGRPVT